MEIRASVQDGPGGATPTRPVQDKAEGARVRPEPAQALGRASPPAQVLVRWWVSAAGPSRSARAARGPYRPIPAAALSSKREASRT